MLSSYTNSFQYMCVCVAVCWLSALQGVLAGRLMDEALTGPLRVLMNWAEWGRLRAPGVGGLSTACLAL